MATDLATRNGAPSDVIERVIAEGDLGQLTPAQRVSYYLETCQSLNLNPLTQPFQYLRLNGKLVLYARRDATDQLRKQNGVSIEPPHIQTINDCYVVTISARDKTGRTDSDVGVVSIAGLRGEALGNALMKAITKGKRRVTLSICGLGLSDESEVETIPNAQPVHVDPRTGVVLEPLSRQAHGYVETFPPADAPSSDYIKEFEADALAAIEAPDKGRHGTDEAQTTPKMRSSDHKEKSGDRQELRARWMALEPTADRLGVQYIRPTREATNNQIATMIRALELAIEQEAANRAAQGKLIEQESTS